MSSKIKVLYITKYNQKEILEKPDNFTYYIKSIMNSNLIDVYLLNPLSLQKGNSIQVLIALVKTIKDINPDIQLTCVCDFYNENLRDDIFKTKPDYVK